MIPQTRHDPVFHRDFFKDYPTAVTAEGVFIYDENGKAYLDASSGAVAANLGHGVHEIAEAMIDQAKKIAFAHTLRFETEAMRQAAQMISDLAPPGLATVYFASGGSEANEAALKLSRQFHLDAGREGKSLTIGRWQSYHGNTLGSLSAGGDVVRRATYTPMLLPFPHVSTPSASGSWETVNSDDVGTSSEISEIERVIARTGPENISSLIVEPIVGSQQGATVPSVEYMTRLRELCDEHGILLIADEVMTGFGRTGRHFAVEHFDLVPDILTFGKGVTGGYAPLSGMIVHDRIVAAVKRNSAGVFRHGYTYSGHPVSVAAGAAALTYYLREDVLSNADRQGAYLRDSLSMLSDRFERMGPVRGRGLLLGFDLLDVAGRPGISSEAFNNLAMKNGAIFYPGRGAIDGIHGQHVLVAPPLTIQREEVDLLVRILKDTLGQEEHGEAESVDRVPSEPDRPDGHRRDPQTPSGVVEGGHPSPTKK